MLSTWCAAVPVEDLICLDGFRAAATDPHGECDAPAFYFRFFLDYILPFEKDSYAKIRQVRFVYTTAT